MPTLQPLTETSEPVSADAEVTAALFRALIHEQFLLAGDQAVIPLQLISITEDLPRAGQRAGFSLLFRSDRRDAYVPQSTYRLEHATAGRWEMFLVPVGPDAGGLLYQAIYN